MKRARLAAALLAALAGACASTGEPPPSAVASLPRKRTETDAVGTPSLADWNSYRSMWTSDSTGVFKTSAIKSGRSSGVTLCFLSPSSTMRRNTRSRLSAGSLMPKDRRF